MKWIVRIFLAPILFIWALCIFYPYFDLLIMYGDLTIAYVAGAIGFSLFSLVTFIYTWRRTNWFSRYLQ